VAAQVARVELKGVEGVAKELREKVEQVQTGVEPSGKRRRQLLKALPAALVPFTDAVLGWLGGSLGLRLDSLGVRPWPHGTCTVLTPPNADQNASEMEVDVLGSGGGGMASGGGGMAPVVVVVGGIRVQSGYMKDKQMAARPVLHMSLSVDLRCGSVHEAKLLAERVQQLMTNPVLLDRYDEQVRKAMAAEREL